MTNQAPQPAPPVSGLGGVLAIVQAVVAIVPRRLVVAAGVIFVAWLGFDLYVNAQMKLLDLQAKQAETRAATATAKGIGSGANVRDDLPTASAATPGADGDMLRKKWMSSGDTPEQGAARKECWSRKARSDDLTGCEKYGIATDDETEKCIKRKARGFDLTGCEQILEQINAPKPGRHGSWKD